MERWVGWGGMGWRGVTFPRHLPSSALCLQQFSSWEQPGNLTIQTYPGCPLGTPVPTMLACTDVVCSEKLS